MNVKRIMVPVDFEQTSALALASAGELATRFGAEIYVVHVVDDEFAMPAGTEGSLSSVPRLKHGVETAVTDQINDMIARAQVKARVTPTVLFASVTAEALVAWARTSQVDLIVMGTHGRGGAPPTAIGSVADHVVRLAPCPVLVVRQPLHAPVAAEKLTESAQGPVSV